MGISPRSQDDEAVEHRFANAYGPETKRHRWTQGMSLQKLLTLGIQSATIMKASRMLTRAHRALVLTLRFHQVRIMTAPGNTVLVLMLRIVSRYTQLI